MKKLKTIASKLSYKSVYLSMIFVFALFFAVCNANHVAASTQAEPDPMPLNEKISGVLTGYDPQYFYITTDNKDVNYEFVLTDTASSESKNFSVLNIKIIVAKYRSDGEYVYEDHLIDQWVNPSKSRTYKQTLKLKKNTKYIIALSAFYAEDTPYTFAVYQTAKTPKIKETTGKNKQVTVQISKVSSASYYEVAIKKQGGSWKTYKTKKTSYTFKKLSSKKTYSVRVRSVRTINGKKHYSAWSSIKKVKTK